MDFAAMSHVSHNTRVYQNQFLLGPDFISPKTSDPTTFSCHGETRGPGTKEPQFGRRSQATPLCIGEWPQLRGTATPGGGGCC